MNAYREWSLIFTFAGVNSHIISRNQESSEKAYETFFEAVKFIKLL